MKTGRLTLAMLILQCSTFAAWAASYTNTTSGNWTNSVTWGGGGCPVNAGDTATIVTGTVTADSDIPLISSVTVTGGKLDLKGTQTASNTATLSGGAMTKSYNGNRDCHWNITLNGGRLDTPPDSCWYIYGNVQVTAPSIIGEDPGDQHDSRGGPKLVLYGSIAGSQKINYDGYGRVTWITNWNNAFTGDWELRGGDRGGELDLMADGALGTGTTTIRAGSTLNIQRSQTAPRMPRVFVDSGGLLTCNNPYNPGLYAYMDVTIAQTGMVQGAINYGGYTFVYYGTNTLVGDVLYDTGKSDVNLEIAARIVESGGPRKVIRVGSYANRFLQFSNPSNTFSGGIEVRIGEVRISKNGAQGSGPITLVSATNGCKLGLDATPDQDWALTNDLAGSGLVLVENGAKMLTSCGAAISPGTGTVSSGILTVSGPLTFATNGNDYVSLNMEITGTSNVAGVDYDRLVVSNALSGLNYADLVVNVSTNLDPSGLQGQGFTVVTCTNDLSAAMFHNVAWSTSVRPPGRWRGTVLYGNGLVALTNLCVIANGTLIILQ